MYWMTYREADGYVVAIHGDEPESAPEGCRVTQVEEELFKPGDELEFLIRVLSTEHGRLTSHIAIQQSLPAREILQRLAGAEDRIKVLEDELAQMKVERG